MTLTSTPTILVPDFYCRHCRRPISPAFIASLVGTNPAGGYLCEICIVTEQENMHRLQSQLNETTLDIDGPTPPCAICNTIEGDTRVLEDYEGAKAFMCKPCADRYLLANRDKIRGTKLEWDLKLK
jgi:hypothetical protein